MSHVSQRKEGETERGVTGMFVVLLQGNDRLSVSMFSMCVCDCVQQIPRLKV